MGRMTEYGSPNQTRLPAADRTDGDKNVLTVLL